MKQKYRAQIQEINTEQKYERVIHDKNVRYEIEKLDRITIKILKNYETEIQERNTGQKYRI